MQTTKATALVVLRPLVTFVPRPARPRLPDLPGTPLVASALVAAASLVLAAGAAALFY